MKKIIASLLLMSSAISMNAAVNVNRIEPTDWYVGMKDASLQLMVYGKYQVADRWDAAFDWDNDACRFPRSPSLCLLSLCL